MKIFDCFKVRLCGEREFIAALHCLAPQLRRLCAQLPEEANLSIERLRSWAQTVPGWRRRIALDLWLNWFERRAKSSIAENAKRLAVESAMTSYTQPPR